jgi:hypothetical protein
MMKVRNQPKLRRVPMYHSGFERSYISCISCLAKKFFHVCFTISLSNIRPIIIYFHSSQCRLIPYLHQRPIYFKTNASIVAILELIRGVRCDEGTESAKVATSAHASFWLNFLHFLPCKEILSCMFYLKDYQLQ